jgi:uncharacterized repeat protein (TIGR01451 family)
MVLATAATFFYFGSATPAAHAKGSQSPAPRSISPVSLPMFFEANQGQTDPRVKFLSRGRGYGLFLTADEAVLELQHSALSSQHSGNHVIRMRLDGANSAARVSGAEPLPGKSNYFIGNDPAKWHRGIPQYARVNYESVYPGIDLTYYGNQGQLEYDFRVAPGADPNQIALAFEGASARLDAGDLVLSTSQGDVLFHAPYIYQSAGNTKKTVAGSFRQLADNKIGFQIGPYDRRRELVIDPVLSYSTYLGGSGIESLSQIAVDSGLNMYVAGSTTSADFPVTDSSTKTGVQNIFVAKINPAGSAILFATYLGGNGSDVPARIAVDLSSNIYVAGTTTSTDFPTTANAFQTSASGTHGFVSKLALSGGVYGLGYSTYLAGNGVDTITGLAIDRKQNAYVTGTTTSTNSLTGFPSTANACQPCPFLPGTNCTVTNGPTQFFASKINTIGSGAGSMVYSTYFGGSNPVTAQAVGGGIAVDSSDRMYFTGGTNLRGVTGPNGEAPFPLANAQQSCLDEPGKTTCTLPNPTALDAFVAKINPGVVGSAGLVYSTYLGGSLDDIGLAIAVDSSNNAYVTGQTSSSDWNAAGSSHFGGGSTDAFIAKVGNPTGSNTTYPLNFFNYLGGSGGDIGRAIAVDSVQAAHVTGATDSADLPVVNPFQTYGGATDAFVALISTTSAAGNYVTYLGGSLFDQGTSIALDANLDSSPTFVAGETQSGNFPTADPLRAALSGPQDAFVARIGSTSTFTLDADPPKVNPDPAAVGNQVTFTFVFDNNGPDPASNVIFSGSLPSSGFTFDSASSSPGGACQNVKDKVTCTVGTVAKGAQATVTVVLTPTAGTTSLTVTPSLSANGGGFTSFTPGTVQVTDFKSTADPASRTINAGESTSFVITLTPLPTYANAISVSHSALPTASTGTFTPSSSVTISGGSPAKTTLNISTTARPVTTGSLLRGGSLYASWLPVGGLSLLGLGLGAGFKRRRWIAGTLLGLLTALIVLQAACGKSSSRTPPSGGTPAGTYSIVLTGSSGSASHNYQVTLVVN